MLDSRALIRLLIQQGLLDDALVATGSFQLTQSPGRNAVFRLIAAGGPNWVVKHARGDVDARLLANETHTYRQIAIGFPALRPHIPELVTYLPDEHVLVLNLIPDASTLREVYAARRGLGDVYPALVGRVLGLIHQLPVACSGEPIRKVDLPWALNLDQPTRDLFLDASSAALELLEILQQRPELAESLAFLRTRWAPTTFTHNDARWDNVLVPREAGMSNAAKCWFIDWELAGIGDPAWDVGSLLADFLNSWYLSIPIARGDVSAQAFEQALQRITSLQPSIGILWQSYIQQRQLNREQEQSLLLQSVRYSAVHLLKTAYEWMTQSSEMPSSLLLYLQLSMNMLRSPHSAAIHICGLQPERGGA